MRDHWFVQKGPNGGFVAALATRALTEVAGGEDRAPRSLTLHYLAPPEAGELEVVAAVERAGRTTTFASLRVLQDGVTVALRARLLQRLARGPAGVGRARAPGRARGRTSSRASSRVEELPRFLSNYEMRPLAAAARRRLDARRASRARPTRCCSPR